MRVNEVQASIGRIPNLRNALRQGRLSLVGFLNIYRNMFQRANGIVRVTVYQAAAIPARPVAAPAQPPTRRRRTDLTRAENRRLRGLAARANFGKGISSVELDVLDGLMLFAD